MDEKNAKLEPYTRARLEAAARGLDRRAKLILPAWIGMLEALQTGEITDDFVDWFEISREDGRDHDIGFERRWIDPTVPLAAEILAPAHGALITSATLRDADAEGRRLAKCGSPHRRPAFAAAAPARLFRLALPL